MEHAINYIKKNRQEREAPQTAELTHQTQQESQNSLLFMKPNVFTMLTTACP
jgi:hypothetical protein